MNDEALAAISQSLKDVEESCAQHAGSLEQLRKTQHDINNALTIFSELPDAVRALQVGMGSVHKKLEEVETMLSNFIRELGKDLVSMRMRIGNAEHQIKELRAAAQSGAGG